MSGKERGNCENNENLLSKNVPSAQYYKARQD